MLGGLIAQYTITQYDNSTIYYISSLLDLTDGKYFVAMEWSMVLERHPLDLMEWRCFYGLMITIYKAIIGANGRAMCFGETTMGVNGMTIDFNGNQPSII